MRPIRNTVLTLTLLLGVALVAAGGSAASTTTPANTAKFPVTVQTSEGAITVPAKPTRILSLSPSATQMLYAIGAGPQVIGVDKYSTYPSNAPRTSFTGAETNAEVYMVKHPDLVLLAYDESHLVAQLHKLGVPAILLPAATTIASAEAQITEIGKVTGHTNGAATENASLTSDLAHIIAPVGKSARGQSYYLELDPTFYSATSKSFIGSLFARLHMTNIADPAGKGSDYPQLSAEYIVKANPDYVFLADTVCCGQTAATFAKRPGFSVLSAVKEHHVVGVNDSLASEWGPHSMEAFLQIIVNAVDPQGSAS